MDGLTVQLSPLPSVTKGGFAPRNRGDRTTVENGLPLTLSSGAVGDSGRAMTWAVAKHAVPSTGGNPLARATTPRERDILMRATIEARTALEEAVDAAAVAAQRARSLTVVLEEALAILAMPEVAPATPPTRAAIVTDRAGLLSPREREVLALVVEGRSNKAIAEALYLSPNTIKTHIASLLNKLHADSRVQLAAIAARQSCGRSADVGHRV